MHKHIKRAYDPYAPSQERSEDWSTHISDNLTEQLVKEEIDRQLATYSGKVARFIKPADVMAYALNRLPTLYAATKRGRQIQEEYARTKLTAQIETVVRQAFAAITNDPLRTANDDWEPPEKNPSEQALAELQVLLKYSGANWDNLVDLVRHRLVQSARGEFYLTEMEFMDWEKYPLHQRLG